MEVERVGPWEWAGVRNGEEIARAGITECWTGRGYGWFHDKGLTSREWVDVTRQVHAGLEEARSNFNRIEIAVYESHEAGHRWAKRLGFELESTCPRYMPNGDTGCIYVIFGSRNG